MAFRCAPILAALIFATAPALAQGQDADRDLTVDQRDAFKAGTARPESLSVTTWVDRPDNIYAVGERFRIFVRPNEDAYITVVNIGPTGRVTQLFPNAYSPNNRVAANRTIEVPPSESGASITVAAPVGVELVKVIASSQPIDLFSPEQLQQSGMFSTAIGGVPALVRSLEVAAASPAASGARVAIENRLIRTVVSRTATIGGTMR